MDIENPKIDPETQLEKLIAEIGRALADRAAEAVLPVAERLGAAERRVSELETALRLLTGIVAQHHGRLFPQSASAPDRNLN